MSQNNSDNRFMEFRLADQLFAVPLLSVKEVIQKPEVTAVPNMPQQFEGMMNLRGQILGVFNVRKKLGAKPKPAEVRNEVVMVIDQLGVNVGMTVDEVTRVLHPNQNMIRSAPLKDDDPAKAYINSVIQTGEDLVLIVDVVELLELSKYSSTRKAA